MALLTPTLGQEAAETATSTVATAEQAADDMLARLREHSPQDVFGNVEELDGDPSELLAVRKRGADLLVQGRLAKFTDDTRTEISLTNAGRYWASNGGYMAYLREEPLAAGGGGGGRQRNPEMEALRAEYMKLRLNTFWWSFGLSIAGFIMSIISVLIAVFYGDRLIR